MNVYRRNLAIENGAAQLLAMDLTIGDTILIRRPGAIERTPETIAGVEYVPGTRMFRIHFHDMPAHETARDMPVSVAAFTEGPWRQHVPFDVAHHTAA